MQRSLTCPKCAHRRFYVIEHADVSRQIEVVLPALFAAKLHGKTAYKQDTVRGFEVMVCAQCGYSEMYATSLEAVAAVGKLVDGDTGGVYR